MTDEAARDALVDVILPTYARPHTLPYAVRSALAQSEPRLLLHVVGDGCGWATEQALAAFDDPRLRFHRFPKAPGFGYANRNCVLRRARAPFVAYMTDDDLWFPDHLERGLAELDARGLDLVGFRSGQVRFPDTADPHFFAFDWRLPLSGFLRNWFMGSVGSIHRRSVFEAVGYWDDALSRFGDREFYNRVRCSPLPSAYLDVITVLRFYAQSWDGRYGRLSEPPQKRYLPLVHDPVWREAFRAAAGPGRRSLAVRRAQAGDFVAFGLRSGPRFMRFWWQRWRRRAPAPPPPAAGPATRAWPPR